MVSQIHSQIKYEMRNLVNIERSFQCIKPMRLVNVNKQYKVNLRAFSVQFLGIGGLIVKRSLQNPNKNKKNQKTRPKKAYS